MIIHGDCREVLAGIPDNTYDTVITDPPYGLSKEPDIAEVMTHWANGDDYEATGGGFMGKSWDSFVPGPATWREVYRVLKPGGTALVFAGTRTCDLMSIAMRFAGFRRVDCIMWIYGSGFPKPADISKQIDKAQGMETIPATTAARQWDGWKSTQLKPAYEPILIMMKANDGTFVNNALKWGVAGFNIDAARVEVDKDNPVPLFNYSHTSRFGRNVPKNLKNKRTGETTTKGRYPANVIHDGSDEVVGLFPDRKSRGEYTNSKTKTKTKKQVFGKDRGVCERTNNYANETGSAARFFYCAKAGKKEKNEGLEGMPEKIIHTLNSSKKENCDEVSGRFKVTTKNTHPTVKPLKLIEYLCKLTSTPTGGFVLDPFAGSGTTGVACVNTGREYHLIEQDAEYVELCRKRVAHAEQSRKLKSEQPELFEGDE